ncbi:MAG TPA: flagellar hook-associated protein FlgK [Alphaproteobacteria bacterium]
MTVNPLNVALSGLRAAQSQISVTSNNIANVSTDGYTRKTLQQYTTVVGNEAAGVRTGQVQRRIDEILLRDYRNQISSTSGLAVTQDYLDQVQDLHGSPDAQISISANIGKLRDAFSQLSNTPENTFALRNVYDKAQQLANQFNSFSDRMTEMRNNVQADMQRSVDNINALSEQIAQLNSSISRATAVGRAVPDLEDQRDVAIRELSKEVELSYYVDGSNSMVVMTKNGQLLADLDANTVYFSSTPLGPGSYYPVSAGAIRLGNPTTGVDLTNGSDLGGRLGALIELRDTTLPVYQAQVDELAHKMAMRFDSQGLRLFSLPDGTIPANTPASYTGFAANIQVNPAVITDINLIRKGTTVGSTVQDGSDEVLRKIVEFTFGSVQYEQLTGTVDVSNTVPLLFTTLGIAAQARITGEANIQALGALDSSPYINPPVEDDFTIQVGAGAPVTIAITAGQTATNLLTTINTAFPGMASLGAGGQLVLTAAQTITIGAGSLGAAGLQELGLTAGATTAVNPSFQIAVGNNNMATVEIAPTDTITQLLTKLNALPGVDASLTVTAPTGRLLIRPDEGGDITVIDGLGSPLAALGLAETNVNHAAFNVTGLGPASALDGRIQNSTTIFDYSTQMVSLQSQDALNVDTDFKTQDNYRASLEKEYLDTTGVNLDEEMANLIAIQNAYTASARAISAVEEMLDELMATFR